MPYAVISDRGKQYTVRPGERVRIHSRDGAVGEKVVFDQVVALVGEGAPRIGSKASGARVEATVVGHGRAKKLVVYKIKRRKGYRRKQGHRQGYTDVRIDAVVP